MSRSLKFLILLALAFAARAHASDWALSFKDQRCVPAPMPVTEILDFARSEGSGCAVERNAKHDFYFVSCQKRGKLYVLSSELKGCQAALAAVRELSTR